MLFNVSLGPAGGDFAEVLCGVGTLPSLSHRDNYLVFGAAAIDF
jgi:hypothetical protein